MPSVATIAIGEEGDVRVVWGERTGRPTRLSMAGLEASTRAVRPIEDWEGAHPDMSFRTGARAVAWHTGDTVRARWQVDRDAGRR